MAPPITRITNWTAKPYSMIIDVRSPSEFAEDHIPGAVSMPVLQDDERAEIGTLHNQVGSFEAKRRGAVLVAKNISNALETFLGDAPKNFSPLIYCWRGGQRSAAMAHIFAEIGWKTDIVDGGYKTYRKQVLDGLDSLPPKFRLIILRGRTGTAKTQILRMAASLGAQIIDLEGLACHRGSLLGGEPGGVQPSARLFESGLHAAFQQFDPAKPIFVESESSKIGNVNIPSTMWKRMRAAESIHLSAAMPARVTFLVDDYQHLIADPERLEPLLKWVITRIGHAAVKEWRQHIKAGDWPGFVTRLLEDHYDPAYDRSAALREHNDIADLQVDDLTPETIRDLAQKLAEFS
ncbi:MAG: tRNA 2-selenouridine(34) synthase MnmH [Bacteroidetes bacterium]|jgi:tRNA 2-selenouridine synthase|nr:tRNA 2-selenouridine(34) synthase MnmH [Bacteroidota bacterium]